MKSSFRRAITLPVVHVPAKVISRILGCHAITSRTVERMNNKIKPVVDSPAVSEKLIMFKPEAIDDSAQKEIVDVIYDLTGSTATFDYHEVMLCYEDWPAKLCISAVLPYGLEFRSEDVNSNLRAATCRVRKSDFVGSLIGHIIHVNLREELLVYKTVIGQILLDKCASCKTVVNKLDAIGHEYRVFDLDLLAGEPYYETEVREEKLRYKLDFSQVFYNPRLSSEHKRIVKKLTNRSVLYDCCAGIGPFVLPAIRSGVHHVIANDLNPNSVKYLKTNLKLNNLSPECIKVFNMDATQFIRLVISEDLVKEVNKFDGEVACDETGIRKPPSDAHVLMNLPGKSLQFLPYFRGILHDKLKSANCRDSLPFPIFIHCHFFVKADEDVKDDWFHEEAKKLVRKSLDFPELEFSDVRFVRDVAGRKQMYCVSFKVPDQFLLMDANTISSHALEESCNVESGTVGCKDNCGTMDREILEVSGKRTTEKSARGENAYPAKRSKFKYSDDTHCS